MEKERTVESMSSETVFGLMAVACTLLVAALCIEGRVHETVVGTICCGVIGFVGLICLYLAMSGGGGKRR